MEENLQTLLNEKNHRISFYGKFKENPDSVSPQ